MSINRIGSLEWGLTLKIWGNVRKGFGHKSHNNFPMNGNIPGNVLPYFFLKLRRQGLNHCWQNNFCHDFVVKVALQFAVAVAILCFHSFHYYLGYIAHHQILAPIIVLKTYISLMNFNYCLNVNRFIKKLTFYNVVRTIFKRRGNDVQLELIALHQISAPNNPILY